MARLTTAKIEALKPKGARYRVGDATVAGLAIEVMASGSKVWRLREYRAGKAAIATLGKYISAAPKDEDDADRVLRTTRGVGLTLDEARAEAADRRHRQSAGLPSAQEELEDDIIAPAAWQEYVREREAVNTFAAVAKRFAKDHERSWSDSRISVVSGFLSNHCGEINDTPIKAVTFQMLVDLLRKVERDAPATAKEGRSILKQVFQSARIAGLIEVNPAADMAGVLQRHDPEPHTPLPRRLIPAFWRALAGLKGVELKDQKPQPISPVTVAAMKLLAITAVRGNELRQAEWSWLEDDVLRFPASAMKMRSPHIVPLSRQAVAILAELKAISGDSRYIFPHRQNWDEPMASDALYQMTRRVVAKLPPGTDFTAHGWRATFSTLAREHALGSDAAIELALAHQRTGVAARYDFSKLVPERRELLQKWADMVLPD